MRTTFMEVNNYYFISTLVYWKGGEATNMKDIDENDLCIILAN